MMPTETPASARNLLLAVVLGLSIWGLYHIIGAFGHGGRQGLVVLVSFAGFLGFWLMLLALRSRRLARAKRP